MISEVTIRIPIQKESDSKAIKQEILNELKKNKIICKSDNFSLIKLKRSIDARRKNIIAVLKYKVYIDEEIPTENYEPHWQIANKNKRVLIIGSGPAGLFGAFKLLEHGITPIILERGENVADRKRSIAQISTKGVVLEDSNYCFGEGGAGTFSDGKLYTRSSKRGDISSVLRLFYYFGADKKILTDAHPHIGTDKLPAIVKSMREKIISLGGEIHFCTKVKDFLITENALGKKEVCGVCAINTKTQEQNDFFADAVLLSAGHSAQDIYKSLFKIEPSALEAKTFAVGVRVEHPRELIDFIQYHGRGENLGAAEYHFTTQQAHRGVYSFCMCPGGFVVPSATGPNEIVVNGMSAANRNSSWSNAAVVVETRIEDVLQDFPDLPPEKKVIAGLLWREALESLTFKNGSITKAPAQRLTDFLSHKESSTLPKTSYAPGVISSRLDEWLPLQIKSRLESCFKEVDAKMKGYISSEALLIASETRTSTPVRILREKESGESPVLKHLFPAGEGSGYSGGIVSSALDGENQCEKIARFLA